jgi:hypothetical protein
MPDQRDDTSTEAQPGGSGSPGRDTAVKRQAGSYARDADQDPEDAPDSTSETRERPR